MKPRRVKAIARKEFIQILRDYRSLWLALAIPILLIVLFGYALTLDVEQVPLVIWDQDRTPQSRDFLNHFQNSRYFQVISYCDNYRTVDQMLNENKALLALVIPTRFSHLLEAGQQTPVQLLVDGSDSNSASIAIGYAQAITGLYNRNILLQKAAAHGIAMTEPIGLEPRVWFNETLKSKNFIIPGLIAVIMMVIASLLTSMTVSREWDRGTMEQLVSTPITSGELILGKFLPYFAIGIIDVTLVASMGHFVFHVPFRGDVMLLFLLSGLFLTGALCWGMLISIVAKNQFMANQIAFLSTFLPAFLLSGFAFPIANMAKPIQLLTYLIPARFFVTILKGLYLKGVGLAILWPQVLYLVIFSILMLILANKKFKKKVG